MRKKNNRKYYYFYIKTNHDNISLKNWLEFTNINKQQPNNIIFIESMINLGLQEVQKQYPNAISYGAECFASKRLINNTPRIKF